MTLADTQRPTRAQQRDHDIALLKALRHKVIGLVAMSNQCGWPLPVSEPLSVIDSNLKGLLLERELDDREVER